MKFFKLIGVGLLLACGLSSHCSAQGRILWDEAMNGPLSQNYVAATQLGELSLGTNSILGSVDATPDQFGWILANDYFTFQVAPGNRLVSVRLMVTDQILAWLGNNFSTQIGYRETASPEELLPFIGGAPIPAGSYAMYLSDENLQSFPTSVNYRLDFVITAVPEPGTWALLGLGGALLWPALRRRGK